MRKLNFHVYLNKATGDLAAFSSRDIGGNYHAPRVIKCSGVPFHRTGKKYKVRSCYEALAAYCTEKRIPLTEHSYRECPPPWLD